MSMLVAALVFVPLLAVSLAHFVWAVGGKWPIRDRERLAATVVGRPGVIRVPRLASLLVAIAALTAGIMALALADHTGGGGMLTVFGVMLAALFLIRGYVGYTARWRAAFPLEPFATLDRKNYSPLCLFIGAGFVILVIMRLI